MRRLQIITAEMDGNLHIQIFSEGESEADALFLVRDVAEAFAEDERNVFWRQKPFAASDLDLDTKVTIHRGHARLSIEGGLEREGD